jgi:UPF0716 protein FxsA
MLARLAFLFVVVPLLELVLLVQLGRWVGLWPTLALVLTTGIAGASLARAQGLRTLAAFQGELTAGRLPSGPLLDGLAVLVGGAFLLTPGLLTDVVGFSLLIPASRGWIRRRVVESLRRMQSEGTIQVGVMSPMGMEFRSGLEGFQGPADGHTPDDDRTPPISGLDPKNEIR